MTEQKMTPQMAVGFLASAIKSGEPFTEQCEQAVAIALAALSHAEGESPFAWHRGGRAHEMLFADDLDGEPADLSDGWEPVYKHPAPQVAGWRSGYPEYDGDGGVCHIPLFGHPDFMVVAFNRDGNLVDSCGDDVGYDLEQVERWHPIGNPAPQVAVPEGFKIARSPIEDNDEIRVSWRDGSNSHMSAWVDRNAAYSDDTTEKLLWKLADALLAAAPTAPAGEPAEIPEIGSQWRHRNGNVYTVESITNESTERPGQYPVTVVYRGENEKLWSRPARDWHRSMTFESAPEQPVSDPDGLPEILAGPCSHITWTPDKKSRADWEDVVIIRHTDYLALTTAPAGEQHPDDVAVDRFAAAMKAKLAKKRTEGRGGWQTASEGHLSALLHEHVAKGDPLDVGNLAMMLHQNGQSVSAQQPVSDPDGLPENPRPMSTAPRDGTMVRLLVQFTENGVNDGFDSGPAWTIGANTYDDSGDDEWYIAGWNWQQDCFTAGEGEPLGWLPMLSAPAPDEREIAAQEIAGALDWINYQIAETPKPQEGYSYRGGVIEGMRTAATRLSDALDRLRAGKEGEQS